MGHEISIIVKAYNQTKAVFQQARSGANDLGKGLRDIFKGNFGKGFSEMGAGLEHFGKAGKQALIGIASAAKTVAVAVAAASVAIIAVGKKALDAYRQETVAQAKLEQALKNSGNAAGYTASELRKMAAAWMKTTGVEDEATEGAMAFLAASGKIRGDNFVRTAKAALDMGAAMKAAGDEEGGVEAAAMALGKALENPEEGLARLTRRGVQFTQAQKDQIKAFQESGNLQAAQAMILAEVERRYSGTAESIHKLTAAQDDLKNSFGEIMEQTGEAISKSKGFQDAMARLSAVINELAESGKLEAYVNRITDSMMLLGRATEWTIDKLKKFSGLEALEAFARAAGGASVPNGGRLQNAKTAVRDASTIEDEAKAIREQRTADAAATRIREQKEADARSAERVDREQADAIAAQQAAEKQVALTAKRLDLERQIAQIKTDEENAKRAELGLAAVPVTLDPSRMAKTYKTAKEEETAITELQSQLTEAQRAQEERDATKRKTAAEKLTDELEKQARAEERVRDAAEKIAEVKLFAGLESDLEGARTELEKIKAIMDAQEALGAVGSKADKDAKKEAARRAKIEALRQQAGLAPMALGAMPAQQVDEEERRANLMKRLGGMFLKRELPFGMAGMTPEQLQNLAAKRGIKISPDDMEVLRRRQNADKLQEAKDKLAAAEAREKKAKEEQQAKDLANMARDAALSLVELQKIATGIAGLAPIV
jgi:hypothetical protein